MAAITFDKELNSPVPAPQLFNALIRDGDTIIPMVIPQVIESVEILQGDGGAGTIKLIITLGEGNQQELVYHKVVALDQENFTYNYDIIEGPWDGSEVISFHVKSIERSDDGGSVCKSRIIYCPEGDTMITQEEIEAGEAKDTSIFEAVVDYILANPDF